MGIQLNELIILEYTVDLANQLFSIAAKSRG